MHVTISDLRAAMGDLGTLEADQDMKSHLTVQAERILAASVTAAPDAILRDVSDMLRLLASYQAWTDSGRGFIGPRYEPSQIVRQNLQQSQTNAISRKQSAAGQTPVRRVETAPAKQVSVWTETAKNLPAAVVARTEEIKRGDVWTEEQRRVVAAPAAAVGIPASSIPKATAPSQPIPDSSPAGPSWWERAVDFAFTAPAPGTGPVATATPSSQPTPVYTQPAAPAPVYAPPPAPPPSSESPTSVPSSSYPAVYTTPSAPSPSDKPFFSGGDVTSMFSSAIKAASQVGTAVAQAQAARSQAASDRRAAYALPAPMVVYGAPAAQPSGLGTTEIVAIGAGVALLLGVGALAVVLSRDDEDDDY